MAERESLPPNVATSDDAGSVMLPVVPSRPLRVFFIEDAEVDARLVIEWLGQAGEAFIVERAATLADALAHLAVSPCCSFDVILADLGLPDSEGAATVDRIIEAKLGLPVVLLTGAEDVEVATNALRGGIADYLLKGRVDGVRLRRTLWQVVAAYRAAREVELTRRTIEAMSFAIFYIEADGAIMSANVAASTALGYGREEICTLNIADIAPDASREVRPARWAELQEAGRVVAERRLRCADGSLFPVEVSSQLITRDGRPMEIAVAQDLSERHKLQASLVQADRLVNVGLLTAGVVHEINNSLTFLMFNLEGLGEELPRLIDVVNRQYIALRDAVGDGIAAGIFAESDAAHLTTGDAQTDILERLEDAIEGAHRVRDIVHDLKTFSRVSDQQTNQVSVNAALDVAANMAANEVKYRARLIRSYGDVPQVLASEGRLAQVFLNLMINAAHAISAGSPEHHEVRLSSWVEGPKVVVEVADTGEGIPPAVLERIFEPFFTTKPSGVGSGLGLGICRDIVSEYGGDITVETELGVGTCFRVSLPIAPALRVPTAPEVVIDDGKIARSRILIADDEASVREALARHFAMHHEVVTATTCAMAKALLEADSDFDLIVCELMMPQVSGRDLYVWLEETHPQLAASMIFLATGALSPELQAFLDHCANPFLAKPFAPSDVCAVAREILRSRRADDA
ncbi:MAG: response regulator [Deltaproteobacteria bacterium]|nr:response regulator [Deltaproteobacteria bacterium]